MSDRETLANDRFKCSSKERACYEAGIKMGTIYHQFVGTPVSLANIDGLEKEMANAIKVQPYVRDAVIRIDRSGFVKNGDIYSYKSLSGDMIDAVVTIELDGINVTSEMRYDRELGYPLMFISEIRE